MSQSDNSMSMNSLMEAIYGDHHQTQYVYDNQQQQQNYTEQLTQFMQSLINHLIELCMTQGSVDNAQRILNPWFRDIKINYRNPKPSLQGFLKDYLRLFEQERNKINKYGQKKLRYLTQTVSKQIFTQIMRLSCDLKFESVNKINNQRSIQKRINNTVLLKHSIDRIFVRDLAIAFRVMKKNYQETIKKEENFVTNVQNSIRKLDMICVKARNSRLWKAVTLWRMKNLQICQQQTIILCTVTKKFFASVLPDIIKIWQDRPSNWVSIIIQHLSILFRDVLQSSQGTVVQFIGNPNFHNNSLDYSAISSYRSNISQISSISIAEYLKNEQIKFDNNNKFLAIPLIIDEDQIGLVKISWQYQLPITLFNRTLRFVQSLKLVIQGFAKISTRLSFYRTEYENSSWHEELYTLCLREEALELKSLEMILQAANIKYLQIYHDKKSPNACIKYGKENGTQIPQNIYKLIWQKIEVTKSFKLEREDKSYEISKLDEQGFCRYSLEQEQQSAVENRLKSTVLQCIVPLLTKNLGKIGCEKCNIKIKQLRPNNQLNEVKNIEASIPKIKLKLNDNLKYIMGIKNSKNIQQVQQEAYNLVKTSFDGCKVFFKMLFNVDDNKDIYAYKSGSDSKRTTIKTIQLHKAVANENICRVEKNEQNRKLKQLSKLMNQSPMFENSDIYLYENEKSKSMKIIPKKLGRKCLLLLSTFQDLPENEVLGVLDRLATELQRNCDVFVKCDLYNWASDITAKNKPNSDFGSNHTIPELNQSLSHLSLTQFARTLCSNLPFVKTLYIWRVFADHAIDLTPQPNQQKPKIKNFPSHLLSIEPIRSHYSANGANKILKQSLNYGQKLQEYLTYIPNFGKEEFKKMYAEAVCGDLDEIGEYTDSRYQQIRQFLVCNGKMSKQDTQFLSIPIQSQTRNYTLLLLLKNPTTHLPNTYFNYLTKHLQRYLTDHLNNAHVSSKNKILQKLNSYRIQKGGLLENRTQKIREIINKFYAYRNFKYQQIQTLSNAVYNMEDGVQYRLKKGMFGVVKRYCLWVRGKYMRGCEVFVTRIKRVFFMAPLIQKCRKMSSMRQGTNRLYGLLHNILNTQNIPSRTTPRTFLSLLTEHTNNRTTSKKISMKNSIISIISTLQQIINRNKTIYFRKGRQNELSLKRSLIILQQQFRLVDPKTIKTAVNFLQGRLNLMLSHCYLGSICVKVYNFGWRGQDDVDVGGNEGRLSFVRNSSFAFFVCMENDDDIQFEGLNNLVQNVLYQILPNWQLNHRKTQNFKLQTLTQLLQKHLHQSLSHIFSIHNHMLINSQLTQNKQLKNKVEYQKQQMKNMKQNMNLNINNQKRQKHKKQIYELKQNINVIQNQLDRCCVEGKIKSKTNAAYRMLRIVGRGEGKGVRGQVGRDFRSEVVDLKKSRRQDKQRYLHEVLGIWSASIKNLIKRTQLTNIQSCFHKLTQLQ